MSSKTQLSLAEAQKMIDRMLEYATEKPGRPIAIAILDNTRTLLSFARMDGSTSNNAHMAINKAWTCVHMGIDTRTVRKRLVEEFGHNLSYFTKPDRLTAIPGGLLIESEDGAILGAIGISGRIADEDEEIAKEGLKAF